MKQKLKILYCKYFGHNWYDSTFARLSYDNNKKKRYDIIKSEHCPRCGEYHEITIAKHLSRAALLNQGWFVEQ